MGKYSKEEENKWSESFKSHLLFAEENILSDWFCFNHGTSVTYTYWIDYPKKEERIIPINFSLFVYNLRLFKRNDFLNGIIQNRKLRNFIIRTNAFQNEMSPIIGWDFSSFIQKDVISFIDSFNPNLLSKNEKHYASFIFGEARRVDVPIVLYFDEDVSWDGKNWKEIKNDRARDYIFHNMGNLSNGSFKGWREAFDYKRFYDNISFYSYPDYRYRDFIILVGDLNKDTLRSITHNIVSRNCQEYKKRDFTPEFLWRHDEEHLRPSCSMIEGCNHLPNFTILALHYDITYEEFCQLFKESPSQIDKLQIQLNRQSIILEEHRKQIENIRIKKEKEDEEKRRIEEIRKYNEKNRHHRDTNITVNNNIFIVGRETYDNITAYVDSYFLDDNSQRYLDTDSELCKNVEYWFRTGLPVNNIPFKLFQEFALHSGIVPYRTNWHIYNQNTRLAGTIDLATLQNSSLIIYLLTTSKDLVVNGQCIKTNSVRQKAKSPINNLQNCSYYRFALKLNILKNIIDNNYK